MPRLIFAIGLALFVPGCRGAFSATNDPATRVTLRADSPEYTVRVDGPLYEAAIGYAFTNNTGTTLSANHCQAPSPPVLEKERADGTWAHAYSPVILTCLTLPPFRLQNGQTHHGTLNVAAGRPGTKILPLFGPDSIPGIYRLRWELRTGPDPDNRTAPLVSAASPPFRLVLP
jgi:hypothetical protein